MVNSFCAFIEKQAIEHSMLTDHIINMDEVPLMFDIPMSWSITEKGQENMSIVTTGHKKITLHWGASILWTWFEIATVVIFKRKIMLKVKFPSAVVMTTNKKWWLDEEMTNFQLIKYYSKHGLQWQRKPSYQDSERPNWNWCWWWNCLEPTLTTKSSMDSVMQNDKRFWMILQCSVCGH